MGSNTNTLLTLIAILTYGSYYQDGFVYSIDDTQGCTNTSCEGSVGGKVVSVSDQAAPCVSTGPQPGNGDPGNRIAPSTGWSSNGAWGIGYVKPENYFDVPSYDVIPGINELSSPCCGSFPSFADFQSFFAETYSNPNPFNQTSFNTCDGLLDGQCNSANIIKFYNQFMTDSYPSNATTTAFPGPTSLYSYAAGLCAVYHNHKGPFAYPSIPEYTNNWYLPSACEMAFDENFCAPGTQSISALKPLIGSYQVNRTCEAGEELSCSKPDAASSSCEVAAKGIRCLAGNYWSSTQMTSNSQKSAWPVMFDKELNLHGFFGVSCGKNVNSGDKANQYGVRCARNLTP